MRIEVSDAERHTLVLALQREISTIDVALAKMGWTGDSRRVRLVAEREGLIELRDRIHNLGLGDDK